MRSRIFSAKKTYTLERKKSRLKKLSNQSLSFFVASMMFIVMLGSAGMFNLASDYFEKQHRTPHALNSNEKLPLDLAADASPITATDEKPAFMTNELRDKLKVNKDRQENGEKQDRTRVKLLDEERTETRKTWLNADGSKTQEVSTQATGYKDQNNKWQDVDVSLTKDFLGRWKTKANSWQASFGDSIEGVRITKGSDTFSMIPQNANKVIPAVTGTTPDQVVTYKNLWQGVDVTYQVSGSQVKESVVINNKNVQTDFGFKITGANLSPVNGDEGSFTLDGAFAGFKLSSATVTTYDRQVERDSSVIAQRLINDTIVVSLDKNWLSQRTAGQFPVIIDPTILPAVFPGTNAFTSTSASTACTAGSACPNIIGHDGVGTSHLDYRFGYQIAIPAPTPPQTNDYLGSAVLHMEMAATPVGITGSEQVKVTRSACPVSSPGFSCIDTAYGTATGIVTISGDIEVGGLYRNAVNGAEPSPTMMVQGEEGGTVDKYKEFDYTKTKVTFTYQKLPTQSLINTSSTSITVPADQGIAVTTQPTLASTVSTDSDGPGPLRYRYIVGTTKAAQAGNNQNLKQTVGGLIADSGTLNQPQWVAPDGVLQDGTTYYWQALAWDGYATTPTPWIYSPAYSFKVDLRNGKDTTQAFDTSGPVSVDFATGNVTTSASTHSISAVGGNLSLGMDYNSPLRSRAGLVGEYFNGSAFTGAALVKRVDPNVQFDWSTGSPSTGLISTDNFVSRWTGYFVAPAQGTYLFGTTSDDGSRVYINDMVTPYLDQWAANPVQVYGTTGVVLAAGQVVQFKYEFKEVTGNAKAEAWVKTTDGTTVTPRVIPNSMLQTGAVALAEPHGLVGRYYTDPGAAHTFPASVDDPTRQFLTRTDTSLNQNWGTGSPVPGGPTDNFLVRWTGQIKVPTTDTYVFGVGSDDGSRVFINGNPTPVTNAWTDHTSSPVVYGAGVALTANTPVNITVEYYENSGGAEFGLYARPQSAPAINVPVDTSWLLPQAQVLPNGWGLSLDGDGSLSYSYASINMGGVTLYDSEGQTHEWKYINGAFTPPTTETGHMIRNGDGTVTLQDEDGQTYIFSANGSIKSVTKPADDRNPAALQYIYSSFNNNPARLTQISDPVSQTNINDASTASRWLKVYYGNDTTNCPAVPAGQGFMAITDAKHQYICGVATSDGRVAGYYYTVNASNFVVLSRIVLPGSESTDYGYSLEGMLTGVRGSLANDAITAGVRSQDATAETTINYDALRRASGVTLPAATAGATRLAHTYEYRPSSTTTLLHVTNATEPNGFSRKVQYDGTYRTTGDTDNANLTTQTTWDAAKDLVRATVDPTGLRSTTLYDYADRATDKYGPAPSAWFDTNTASATYNKPLTTPTDYTPQVPHSQSTYEENINGLAAAYHEVTTASNGTGSSTKVLFGNPKLHGTGVGLASGDILKTWGGTPPITPTSGNGWGASLTGWIHLTANGNHTFRVRSDDGARLWVGDTIVTDDWTDGALRNHPVNAANPAINNVFNNTQGDKWYRVRLDYYNKSVGTVLNTDAQLELYMTPPAGGETSAIGSLLKPNYGLVTTSKSFDSNASVGDQIATKSYGANPEQGLVQSSTVDPSGLALATSSTYETAGAGSFLRQLSSTLPGGEATSYIYYGAAETRANPCVAGSPAVSQAGMLKLKTEPDPDGAGVQTSITSETVYDITGKVVATRLNADPWRCTTYDTRSRVTQVVTPAQPDTAHVTRSARTVLNNYAVSGNPFVTSIADASGTITKTVDLLGRTTNYKETQVGSSDAPATAYTYDSIGRLTSKSNYNAESYTYDNYSRIADHLYNNHILATSSYDAFSRLQQVTYPPAGQQKVVLARDNLGRLNSKTYTYNDGSTIADVVSLSQSGQVLTGTENGSAKSYTYDKAARLTNATIGVNTYVYSYAAPNTTTCSQSSANLNSQKSSNITSQTINGTATTFCYDKADRLIASSNASYSAPTYDAHGNMSTGSPTSSVKMEYDSSDRSVYTIDSSTSRGETNPRDALDRVQQSSSGVYYGYTGTDDTPDLSHASTGGFVEAYIHLEDGTLATTTATGAPQYSFTNIHGDVFAMTLITGVSDDTFRYQPFGASIGVKTDNIFFGNADYGYLGQYGKTANGTSSQFVQMGARLYLPVIGRFAQVDPIYGGNANNYAYPNDPVNNKDLNGKCPFCEVLVNLYIRSLPAVTELVNILTESPSVNTKAAPLAEQLAMREVRANPSLGSEIMKKQKIHDTRFLYKNGWRKMQYTHEPMTSRGSRVTLHYFYNLETLKVEQLKVKSLNGKEY